MAHYSQKHEFLFIHIPKTAGVSIIESLHRATGDLRSVQDDRWNNDIKHDPVFDNHYTYQQVRNTYATLGSNIRPDTFRPFWVIRNPWARMVSLYHHRLRKPKYNTINDQRVLEGGFTNWLINTQHVSDWSLTKTPQTSWIESGPYAPGHSAWMRFGNVLKMEELTAGKLQKITGIPRIDLGHRNTDNVRQDYREYYDAESLGHINRFFNSDIELGEYEF
jgi:hypothetical protein